MHKIYHIAHLNCLTCFTVLTVMLCTISGYIDGSVQERCNSIAYALELHLFCINPSICGHVFVILNLLQETKQYPLFYNFSIIWWHRLLISFLVVDKNPFILHSQYHGCWYPGNARSQGWILEMIPSWLAQIQSCNHDQLITFHKRQSWSAH